MSSVDKKRIYRKGRIPKLIVSVCIGVALFIFALYIFLLFYFQRYIVYTDDGIRLDIPWMQEEVVDGNSAE